MALVNPNIAMSYRAPEMPNQLANYAALQQIRGGQQAQEASQMQIDKLKRDEDALSTMMQTITSKGGPRDPTAAAEAMIKSGIPHFMDAGLKLQMAHQQTLQDRAAMGLPAIGAAAAPTNAMAPAAQYPQAAPRDALGTGTFGMGMPAPTNAMAPAPVNALANKDAQIRQAKEMLLSTNPGVRVAGEQQLKALTTPPVMHSVAPGAALVGPDGKVMYTAPERAKTTDLMANYEAAKVQGFSGSIFDYERRIKEAGRTPAQPVAPTITTIADPINLGKSIVVDARTYRGGGVGSPGVIGAGGKDEKTAVSEQQAAYNIGRVLTAADQINKITKTDPSALKPGMGEAAAASMGMSGTANLARNANRQIVSGAQRDALDALLYLATGAAYNKEQLEGQMAAYIPSYTDEPETVAAKKTRMTDLIGSAKTRAGKAWTPQMESAMKSLIEPGASSAASGKVTPAASNVVVTPDGQSHTFPTPAAAAQFKKAAGIP